MYGEPTERPSTETEWLMQPHVETPDLDEAHIDAVALAIDYLTPDDAALINAIFFERVPYSQLAKRLGCSKPHAWRRTQEAMGRLANILRNNPSINERYDLDDDD